MIVMPYKKNWIGPWSFILSTGQPLFATHHLCKDPKEREGHWEQLNEEEIRKAILPMGDALDPILTG